MLMAGLDGIQNKIEPPTPIDKDLYELEPEEAAQITSTPGSLGEVLSALEADHEFLLKGDVFTLDLIETWIDYKRERELNPVSLRPHPYEFFLFSHMCVDSLKGVKPTRACVSPRGIYVRGVSGKG